MLVQILLTFVILIAFVYIYRKYKTDNEEFLIFKLIGYYLLGAFRFNFNKIALPAGFIIYALFFKPYINKTVKKATVYLGLFIFICGLAIPALQETYFERQRKVTASSSNIYTIDFNSDFNAIKQKLGIKENTKIENFDASFENSGEIENFRCTLLTRDNEGIILYNVNLSSNRKEYTIRPQKVKEWMQYDRLINEEQFFYALSHLDFKEMKPQQEYSSYAFICRGDYESYAVKDWDNFLITDNGLKKLDDDKLPVRGYSFWIYGISEAGENRSSSVSNKAYILSNQTY